MNINQIQEAMRADGSHWWDPEAMRFFGTRVVGAVQQGPGGVFFVTCDKRYDGSRGYTVRQYTPASKDVGTVGELAGYRTGDEATSVARDAAANHTYVGEAVTVADNTPHRPVTVAQQFLADLAAHGDRDAIDGMASALMGARSLMADATAHHKLMEDQCNGTNQCPECGGAGQLPGEADDVGNVDPYGADCEPCAGTGTRGVGRVRARLVTQASRFGAKVRFSGDPRGCTVKLVFEDGATNDWGREGWCVPIREES